MGFRIDLENNEINKYETPTRKIKGASLIFLQNLLNKRIDQIKSEKVLQKDKRIISNYLYRKLCYHFEGFERLKSFKVARDILNNG